MPHITIKHFPHDLTDQQKEDLAASLTAIVTWEFAVPASAVSIALEPVAQDDWNETVYEPEITGRSHLLIKAPDYTQNS